MSITPYLIRLPSERFLCAPTPRLYSMSSMPLYDDKDMHTLLLIFNSYQLAYKFRRELHKIGRFPSHYDCKIKPNQKLTLTTKLVTDNETTRVDFKKCKPHPFDLLKPSQITRMCMYGDYLFFLVTSFDIHKNENIFADSPDFLNLNGVQLQNQIEMSAEDQTFMCIHELERYYK